MWNFICINSSCYRPGEVPDVVGLVRHVKTFLFTGIVSRFVKEDQKPTYENVTEEQILIMNPAGETLTQRRLSRAVLVQISCSTVDLRADKTKGCCCVMIPACGGNEMHINSLQTHSLWVSIPSMSSDQASDRSHFFRPVFVSES